MCCGMGRESEAHPLRKASNSAITDARIIGTSLLQRYELCPACEVAMACGLANGIDNYLVKVCRLRGNVLYAVMSGPSRNV